MRDGNDSMGSDTSPCSRRNKSAPSSGCTREAPDSSGSVGGMPLGQAVGDDWLAAPPALGAPGPGRTPPLHGRAPGSGDTFSHDCSGPKTIPRISRSSTSTSHTLGRSPPTVRTWCHILASHHCHNASPSEPPSPCRRRALWSFPVVVLPRCQRMS